MMHLTLSEKEVLWHGDVRREEWGLALSRAQEQCGALRYSHRIENNQLCSYLQHKHHCYVSQDKHPCNLASVAELEARTSAWSELWHANDHWRQF